MYDTSLRPAASSQNKKIFLASFGVFIVFLAYYLWTSSVLPRGAGPDYRSNNEATAFFFTHHRMAVLPDDEEQVYFTSHGGTRVLRPPLSYIVSAIVAQFYETDTEKERFLAFRKGSALLMAAAVAIGCYGFFVLLQSPLLALLGAALFGLLPQATFIASYNNDDSAAIFSATMLITLMVGTYRYGLTPFRFALLGLATGLAILSKFSAWLITPFVLLFVAYVALTTLRPMQWVRYSALAAVMVVLGGGWWILSNIYHYGIDDPLAMKIQQMMIDTHRRLLVSEAHGYAAINIGFRELWLDNYKNFIGETLKSTIGNLDWLRLKVGNLQYLVYKSIFAVAMLYYIFRLLSFANSGLRQKLDTANIRRFVFETILFSACVFQVYMYTWTNIQNDIQVQGKYLLPVLMAVLLLFFMAWDGARSWLFGKLAARNIERIQISPKSLYSGVIVAAIVGVIAVHMDALTNYVIPYYRPPLYNVGVSHFQAVKRKDLVPETVNNLKVDRQVSRIQFTSTGDDPWVVWSSNLCRYLRGNTLLRFRLQSTQRNLFQIYIDEGEGFKEENSFKYTYNPGDEEIVFPLALKKCRRIRFDPALGEASIVIQDIAVARMIIRARR
ncbi:MAG TPA: hypothetical protein ENI80_08905 [Acidiferrobacteraceae bacterium]|nr:hypothetical protein [Acidiferrobacteraceae bacterium]